MKLAKTKDKSNYLFFLLLGRVIVVFVRSFLE
jgi:hypothetical protein